MIDYLADQRQQIVKFTQFSLVFSLVLSDLKFKRNEKLRLNPVQETLSWQQYPRHTHREIFDIWVL